MGNTFRCPKGFNPSVQGCFITCPLSQGFVQVSNNGGPPSCAFRDDRGNVDNTSTVVLQPTPFLPPPAKDEESTASPAPTMEEVMTMYPDLYPTYIAEKQRFDRELQLSLTKLGEAVVIQQAFRRLQEAESARDTAPEAYIAARNAYYRLTQGDQWVEKEKRRIENTDVYPVLRQTLADYTYATERSEQAGYLARLLDAVQTKTSKMEMEFGTGVEMLGKQLEKVQNELNMERRKTEQKPPVIIPFFGYILNILLGFAILSSIVMVMKAIQNRGRNQPVFAGPVYYQ
jgi:hypothetical protein